MAPELHELVGSHGVVSVSQAVDVYSFGVLLASLFAGEVNWGEKLPVDLGARSARLRELSLSGAVPALPEDVQVGHARHLVTSSPRHLVTSS